MRRLLLTLQKKRCPFGCTYCFASFTQYDRPLTLEEVEEHPAVLKDVDVVYPSCDIDLFALKDPIGVLERVSRLERSVSVSTKAKLSEEVVLCLANVARSIEEMGHVLKIGVSFSTKLLIESIEPRTAPYRDRMENLRLLKTHGIWSCLVLKPILIDVPAEEYCEIVTDASLLTSSVLVGDEYLDADGEHRRASSAIEPRLSNRQVAWAARQPTWPVRMAEKHVHAIEACAEDLGMCCFASDLDLMESLIPRRITPKEAHDYEGWC